MRPAVKDENSENIIENGFKDVEAMYELIPAEYLENNCEMEASSQTRVKYNDDEFAASYDGFNDDENAQEMLRIIGNPQGYQKALKVLGRVETRRPSNVRKGSIKSPQIPQLRIIKISLVPQCSADFA